MSQKDKGIYNKYYVNRVDKSDMMEGDKHFECDYFVLDLSHDKHAIPAILAYAKSARKDGFELLADELESRINLIK